MPEPANGLRLEVAREPDADAAELERATSPLREELLALDLERVGRPTEPSPPGSRGLDVAALGTLIVGAGRGAIGPVLTAVQSWIARRSSRSVTITIDGDSLELTNASREDQRRVVASFLAWHSP
jgi:hypothetical protein